MEDEQDMEVLKQNLKQKQHKINDLEKKLKMTELKVRKQVNGLNLTVEAEQILNEQLKGQLQKAITKIEQLNTTNSLGSSPSDSPNRKMKIKQMFSINLQELQQEQYDFSNSSKKNQSSDYKDTEIEQIELDYQRNQIGNISNFEINIPAVNGINNQGLSISQEIEQKNINQFLEEIKSKNQHIIELQQILQDKENMIEQGMSKIQIEYEQQMIILESNLAQQNQEKIEDHQQQSFQEILRLEQKLSEQETYFFKEIQKRENKIYEQTKIIQDYQNLKENDFNKGFQQAQLNFQSERDQLNLQIENLKKENKNLLMENNNYFNHIREIEQNLQYLKQEKAQFEAQLQEIANQGDKKTHNLQQQENVQNEKSFEIDEFLLNFQSHSHNDQPSHLNLQFKNSINYFTQQNNKVNEMSNENHNHQNHENNHLDFSNKQLFTLGDELNELEQLNNSHLIDQKNFSDLQKEIRCYQEIMNDLKLVLSNFDTSYMFINDIEISKKFQEVISLIQQNGKNVTENETETDFDNKAIYQNGNNKSYDEFSQTSKQCQKMRLNFSDSFGQNDEVNEDIKINTQLINYQEISPKQNEQIKEQQFEINALNQQNQILKDANQELNKKLIIFENEIKEMCKRFQLQNEKHLLETKNILEELKFFQKIAIETKLCLAEITQEKDNFEIQNKQFQKQFIQFNQKLFSNKR